MRTAKPEERAGELQQPQEVRAVLVIADEQRAALGQPHQRPLDDPTACREPLLAGRVIVGFVQAQVLRLLRRGLGALDHNGVQRRGHLPGGGGSRPPLCDP